MTDKKISKQEMGDFIQTVKDFYISQGRHDLPWRHTRDPYAILVSEIMLQQTQVPRVIEKWNNWLNIFPTIQSLSEASTFDVLQHWQGLGYNRRALALQKLAQTVQKDFEGIIPQDTESLISLPGIGPYTAGAVCAFAFNIPSVFIETNIRTLFIHHFFQDQTSVHDSQLLPLIEQTLDYSNPREWYYALMDYGSFIKKTFNSSRKSKHYNKQSPFKGSNREQRAFILTYILSVTEASKEQIKEALRQHLSERLETESNVATFFEKFDENIAKMSKEGFITF